MGWHINVLNDAVPDAPLAAFGLSGYVYANEGTQHILYQGLVNGEADGHIHELWWKSGWNRADLMIDKSKPPLAAGDASGYVYSDDAGIQHAVYQSLVPGQGPDGEVRVISWGLGGQSTRDVTAVSGAPPALTDPAGFPIDSFPGNEFSPLAEQVIYTGNDHHIIYLRRHVGQEWTASDLTADTGQAVSGNATSPTAYLFAGQNTQHVLYWGADNHIHRFWSLTSDLHWHPEDLTTLASGRPANGVPTGYAVEATHTQLIHYRADNGHLHQLRWAEAVWQPSDMTTLFNGPAVTRDGSGLVQAGFDYPFEGTQHVYYVGTDGMVNEYFHDLNGWHHFALGVRLVAPPALSAPVAYVFQAELTKHVVYVATDHRIVELWWEPD